MYSINQNSTIIIPRSRYLFFSLIFPICAVNVVFLLRRFRAETQENVREKDVIICQGKVDADANTLSLSPEVIHWIVSGVSRLSEGIKNLWRSSNRILSNPTKYKKENI